MNLQNALRSVGQENHYDFDSPSITGSPRKVKRNLSRKQVSFTKRKNAKEDETSVCSATETTMSSASLVNLGRMSPEKQRSLRNLALNILSSQEPVSPLREKLSPSRSPRERYQEAGKEDSSRDLPALLFKLANALESQKSPSMLKLDISNSSSKLDNSTSKSKLDYSGTVETDEGSLAYDSLTEEDDETGGESRPKERSFIPYAPSMVNIDDKDTLWVHSPSTPRPHLELNITRKKPVSQRQPESPRPPQSPPKLASRLFSPLQRLGRRHSMPLKK